MAALSLFGEGLEDLPIALVGILSWRRAWPSPQEPLGELGLLLALALRRWSQQRRTSWSAALPADSGDGGDLNRFYRWERSQEYVVRLGATFVDIDCGRRPLDWSAWEATQILRDLVQRGLLAQPSMYQFSGRSLWAFWLLRDEQDSSTTPFANYENRDLWMSLQQRTADVIATAFPSLKLDRLAGDLTRVTRLHGSMNSAAERQVRYELLAPWSGREPVRYSLEELAGFYGLPCPVRSWAPFESEEDRRDLALEAHCRRQDEREEERRRRETARAGVDPQLSDLGRQGHITLWRNRLRFLDRVWVEVHGGRLAAFAGLDPVADLERIEQLGLSLSTGPKGQKERTRARRELAREIVLAALDRGEDPGMSSSTHRHRGGMHSSLRSPGRQGAATPQDVGVRSLTGSSSCGLMPLRISAKAAYNLACPRAISQAET